MKELVYNELNKIIGQKITQLNKAIESAMESRDLHTKSSAGDKHETSRAMMQIELENLMSQLTKNTDLKNELSQINLQQKHKSIGFGSLAITNQGRYFISIGMGKKLINNDTYYCISLASPIGSLLKNKKVGETFKFQEKDFIITEII